MKNSISAISSDKDWTVKALVSITHKALFLLSSVNQLELLRTLNEAQFHKIGPIEYDSTVSLENTLSKAQCLQRTDIYLNFSELWPTSNQKYESSILSLLIDRKLFGKAQEFCTLCNLPTVQIVKSQWTDLISQEKYLADPDCWQSIDADFRRNNICDEEIFEFFINASDSIKSPVDKYKFMKLGLERSCVFHSDLYRRMYCLCLNDDFDLTRLNECWGFDPAVPTDKLLTPRGSFCNKTDDKLTPKDSSFNSKTGTIEVEKDITLSDEQHSRLDQLIASMLDRGK